MFRFKTKQIQRKERGLIVVEEMLEMRVARVESDVTEIKSAVKSIDESLKALVRLEVHHEETRDGLHRAFSEIEKIEERLSSIEVKMPTLQLTSGWVISALIIAAGATGAAVMKALI